MISWLILVAQLMCVTESKLGQKDLRPSNNIIQTKYGKLRGSYFYLKDRDLQPVEVFLGVGYARPPLRDLRFLPPITPLQWDGVHLCDTLPPVCPQTLPDIANETEALKRLPRIRFEAIKNMLPYLQDQSEDCLYLNIYLPYKEHASSSGGEGLLPVMVYIHGESFEWNAGNVYDGSVLASFGNVVVITINYRLGRLGFLNAHPTEGVVANLGLLDQIAALQWIQENIRAFGGDKERVTLAGHGTGAACIGFLVMSPAVPPGLLFHRVIMMSGSPLSEWALTPDPNLHAMELADHFNCSSSMHGLRDEDDHLNSQDQPMYSDEHDTLTECLRTMHYTDIMAVPIQPPRFLPAFGPSVDGVLIESFYKTALLDQRIDRAEAYNILAGVVKSEAFFDFSEREILYGITPGERNRIFRTLVRNAYTYHLREIYATIIHEYRRWESSTEQNSLVRDSTLEALTDGRYGAPVFSMTNQMSSEHTKAWVYVFNYHSHRGRDYERFGSINGDELEYLFGAPLVGGLGPFRRQYLSRDVALSTAVMIFMTNFVKTGDPNKPQPIKFMFEESIKDKEKHQDINWIPYENIMQKYLDIDLRPRLRNHYRAHKMALWNNLIPELHLSGDDGNASFAHHLFHNHHNKLLYRGRVRFVPFQNLSLGTDDFLEEEPSEGRDSDVRTTITGRQKTNLTTPTSLEITTQPGHMISTSHSNQTAVSTMILPLDETVSKWYENPRTLFIIIVVGSCFMLINFVVLICACYQNYKMKKKNRKLSKKCSSLEESKSKNDSSDSIEMETPFSTIESFQSVSALAVPPPPPDFIDVVTFRPNGVPGRHVTFEDQRRRTSPSQTQLPHTEVWLDPKTSVINTLL